MSDLAEPSYLGSSTVLSKTPERLNSTCNEPVQTQEQCSRDITEKKYNVSNIVWVHFEDVVTEKKLQEKWTIKKYYNNNYNYYGEGCIKTLRSTLFNLYDNYN